MFADLSDRAIAELCGVGAPFVGKIRGQVVIVTTSQVSNLDTSEQTPTTKPKTRKGKDGKKRKVKPTPAHAARRAIREQLVTVTSSNPAHAGAEGNGLGESPSCLGLVVSELGSNPSCFDLVLPSRARR